MAVNQEIERKFLISGDYRPFVVSSHRIAQGYLYTRRGHTVRVRIRAEKGYLTIKGMSDRSGVSRLEWEIEICFSLAERLMSLCESCQIIDKTRHIVPVGIHLFEVDEFHGINEGLTIAEVELSFDDEHFERPEWLGVEVTGDRQYYNSQIAQCNGKKR